MLRAGDLARAESLLSDYIHGSQDIDELWESHHELHLALLRPAASEWDLRILSQLWHAAPRTGRPGRVSPATAPVILTSALSGFGGI